MSRSRNTAFVVNTAERLHRGAAVAGVMHNTIVKRDGKRLTLSGGRECIEFVSCSYLGLDENEAVLSGYEGVVEQWGSNICCARTRLSIEPQIQLESELGTLFNSRVVVFPSVSTAHMSTLPLVASGQMWDELGAGVSLIFDRHAHASMQFLRPILEAEATVLTAPHNDLSALVSLVHQEKNKGKTVVHVTDGVYSLGELCPINDLRKLASELGFYLYIDDAHGTSIFGEQGEGTVTSNQRPLEENVIVTFSLSKGFGCAGGGVALPTSKMEEKIRLFGQVYAFSAPLDFTAVGGCLASLRLHRDGTVRRLQQKLREKVALFDACLGKSLPFSPLRTIPVGSAEQSIDIAKTLLDAGFLCSSFFFPSVARDNSQIRICISVSHSDEEICRFGSHLADLVPRYLKHVA